MNTYHAIMLFGLAAYASAAILFLLAFPKAQKRRLQTARWAFATFCAATVTMTVLLVTTYLCSFGSDCSTAPISGLMLSTAMSWLTIVAYFAFGMRILGTFVAPVATVIPLIELLMMHGEGHLSQQPSGAFLLFHIGMAVIGEAFAILACGIAILYLMQQRRLKSKQINLLSAIAPPLYKLDQALFFSLWAGFSFMTVGLISGAAAVLLYPSANISTNNAKVIWALAVWGWYLAILLAKNIFNVPARRITYMCVIGFALLAVFVFGLFPWETPA